MIEAPLFIVGAGRSGTTLLRAALSAHPRIAVTPETHYLKRADQHGAIQKDAPADFEAFWAQLTNWTRFHDLDVRKERVLELASAAGKPGFREVFAAMLAAYGEANGKPRVGEKTPGHYRYWQRLLEWFPDARLIAIRRDPRAVAASALEAPWIRDQMQPEARLAPFVRRSRIYHVAGQARGWQRIYGEYVPAAARDSRVMVMSYEDLIRDPETMLRAVCGHIGEAYDSAMLTHRGVVRGAAATAGSKAGTWTGWVAEHEAQAAREISDAGLLRWRGILSTTEQAMIEAICGNTMRQSGYTLVSEGMRYRLGGGIAHSLINANRFETWVRQIVRR